mmetsp:Transcript_28693/g.37617  ORF Transcript_28693/g.37617 Transcript_28693/m.37617 type:complete len:316 (+) Transcript_28693:35-982(+)
MQRVQIFSSSLKALFFWWSFFFSCFLPIATAFIQHFQPACLERSNLQQSNFHRVTMIANANEAEHVSNVRIPNHENGYELASFIEERNHDSRSILVMCHGLLSSKAGTTIHGISQRLPNINVCRFDFGGNGESGGDFIYAGYQREISDLRAVIEYLRSNQWDVKAILGHSKGATCVTQYAAKYDDVDLIVNLSGRYHMMTQAKGRFTDEQMRQLEEEGSFMWEVKGNQYPVTQQDYEERRQLDVSVTQNIQRGKVLTIHGTADETIPVGDAYEWDNVIPNHRLQVIEGAGHSFRSSEEQDSVAALVQSFLSEENF